MTRAAGKTWDALADDEHAAAASDPCPDENVFAALVEGALPSASRAAIERHVDTCARCHELVVALLQSAPSRDDPDAAPSGHDDTQRSDLGSQPTLAANAPADRQTTLPKLPSRLGRYLVIETLGAGGMGVVYAAYSTDRR